MNWKNTSISIYGIYVEISRLSFPSALLLVLRVVDLVTLHISSCLSGSPLTLSSSPSWTMPVFIIEAHVSWWCWAGVDMLKWAQMEAASKILSAHSVFGLQAYSHSDQMQQRASLWHGKLLPRCTTHEEKIGTSFCSRLATCQILRAWSVQGVLPPTHCFVHLEAGWFLAASTVRAYEYGSDWRHDWVLLRV